MIEKDGDDYENSRQKIIQIIREIEKEIAIKIEYCSITMNTCKGVLSNKNFLCDQDGGGGRHQ